MNIKGSADAESEYIQVRAVLTEKGAKITQQTAIDRLGSSGYGVTENGEFRLTYFEALYLLDKGLIQIADEEDKSIDFQRLLKIYENSDSNAWSKYLIYRDMRSRGYVVREGFGLGVDFRIYERGEYSKDTAKYLILTLQEGRPISLEDLGKTVRQCISLKKELILAVMNRRGEIVYYSVSEMTMK